MATTPEEFFVEGLMEPAPTSPSVFLDLPPTPDGNGESLSSTDEHVPSYILHMLMEDNVDDNIMYQYSDHPALLQVQQSFAQILSSPTFGAINNTVNKGNMEGTEDLLQDSSGDRRTLGSALSKDADLAGAFLKGMEEASRFLPRDTGFRVDEKVNQMFREISNIRKIKKRYTMEGHQDDVGRARKAMMMVEELEAMFDEIMLRGYETCIGDMEKLRIAKAKEAMEGDKKGSSKPKRDFVDLCKLLSSCAQAVAVNNRVRAYELLKQIKQHASSTGDATQRLAQCFAIGLEVRLAGRGSHLWQSLMAERPSFMDFLKAYNLYMAVCCFNRVAFSFSVMTIVHVMAGKNRLHIVDYGMQNGFQWAGLLRWMANWEGGPPEVKITAIRLFQPKSCPAKQIEEIGHRLSKCAHDFGVPFKFDVINERWESVCIKNLNTDSDEVLVVNDLFNLHILMDESIYFDKPNPRDVVLNNIRKMKPDVFIQGIVNCSYGTSFLTRFREALFYYGAVFDLLDATIPREGKIRLVLEQGILGHSMLNVIACEGMDLVNRPEKYKQWHVRNQRAGLRQLPLKQNIVKVLKDKVKNDHHKDFFVSEDGQWLLQGWMGRILFAHSTWVAEDAFYE
ncbi:hypothetical protein ACP70R_007952 [Stipagrostis hirtigluma subsp. patula]